MSVLSVREVQPLGAGLVSSRPRTIPPKAWIGFLGLEAVFALIYFPFGIPTGEPRILGFLPWMEWPGQVFAWALLGLSAVAAIVIGVRYYRPNAPIAWWFIAAGVFLFITGDTIFKFWHQIMGQQNIPFPSFVDAIYVTMYPVLAIGLLLLARARVPGGDRASLLDALTITLGVGLLSWIFLIGPNVRAPGGMLVRLTAAAYPLGDVLVLAMLAALWSAGGVRNTSGRLLAIGALGTLASDSLYGFANLHPNWHWSDGNPIDLGWIVFYACWGAAALHPSMKELSEPRPAAVTRTSHSRLVLLAIVSLIAPAVLLVEVAVGDPIDAPIIAVVAGVMFLLVLLRMSGLVRVHQQALVREQVLRGSAADLVAASSRDEIYQAAIEGISALVSGHTEVIGATLAVADTSGDPAVVARSGAESKHEHENLTSLWTQLQASSTNGKVPSQGVDVRTVQIGPSDFEPSEQLVCPIVATHQLQGLIAVKNASKLPVELQSSIEILSAQVGLAIDREAMTEAIHARRSEARFQTLVQNASDVILIASPDTTITYQTPSAKRILGYAAGSLEGRKFTSLVHPEDVEQALAGFTKALRAGASLTTDLRVRHSDGGWRDVEMTTTNLLSDPTVEGIVLTVRDVTERKNLEKELKHQVFHDALSGLANRALFRDRLEHALARAARMKTSLAVIFLDLDDFKLVNDSLGHSAGDALLVIVAERLRECLRDGDTAARFGGDEFAVLLEETTGSEDAARVAERILSELRTPMVIEDHEIQTYASIGIAFSPDGAEDPSELLQAADVAMYAAKARGKGCYEVYQPALQVAVVERLGRTADLQRAVDAREFVVHYQPIMDLEAGRAIGLEALVRWNHPERGLLPPADFIHIAEETGLIVPLGRWVLREACRMTRQWQLQHKSARSLQISVNISARHFQHEGLVDDVLVAVQEADLDPRCLVLEITESVFVQDAESVVTRMLELKALGVAFAIDDFGTGYSSLSYLRRFPIDILKLDKSFVDDVSESVENGALAETIVQLGRTLHLQTVAEGIERVEQVRTLRSFGCEFGQGFYLARPLESGDVAKFLRLKPRSAPPFEAIAPSQTEETVG